MDIRIGFGIDFHKLVEGRELWIGGIKIPHHKGALAHSDGDVLLHAICDALLGALALGDIGTHFPDTNEEFKNIQSRVLLERVFALVVERNYKIVNIDSVICLEAPKIKMFTDAMRLLISGILKISIDDVSVKATTTEQMGFVGREEGLIAYANVIVQRESE